tara:strand:+ start:3403 stop:5280 length:1878 start_codon:yes stop_codon:yes gene_type:complete
MAETKVPAIKNIPAQVDTETKLALESMKEALEVRLGRRGDPKDRAVTLRELIDSGLATDLAKAPYNPNIAGATGFGPAADEVGDVTVPPAPTSLTASGLFTDVLLSWNQSTNTAPYGNHAFTEIWRSQAEDLSSAVLVGTTNAFIYTDKGLEYDSTYYYWVRFISTTNTPGVYSNMASATTVENIGATMAALSETLADLPGYNLIATGAAAATVIKQSSSPSTRADGSALGVHDFWFDTDDGQIYTRNAANNAWVAGRDSTLVSLYGSTSYTGSTITAAMASAQADIVTVTNSQSATATAVTNLTSTVTSNNNTLTASVNTLNTTTANLNGDVNAMFVLQVATESNGSKSAAGMVVGSNASNGSGAQSYVQFQADKFAIWNGSSSTAPFIVSGGTVFIDSARIQDGAINTARIANAAIQTAKIGDAQITTAKIANLQVTNALIADATIQDAKIVSLNATKISAGLIDAARINVDTLNVKFFANTSSKIYNHLSTSTAVPLLRYGSAIRGAGGSTIYTGSNSSFVPVTITNVRNNASYTAVLSAVLGNVSGGSVQFSLDNSTWTTASGGEPSIYWNAGTYRGYVYTYQGQITGLSTSQSTVYWRVYFSGTYNHTHMQLHVTMDNTT